jgi:hypothetical protein
VLISSETIEAQGFLFEGGDDCAVVDHRDEEEEMPDTNIPWYVIGEAMGEDEQLQLRQSARMRDLFCTRGILSLKKNYLTKMTLWRKIEL